MLVANFFWPIILTEVTATAKFAFFLEAGNSVYVAAWLLILVVLAGQFIEKKFVLFRGANGVATLDRRVSNYGIHRKEECLVVVRRTCTWIPSFKLRSIVLLIFNMRQLVKVRQRFSSFTIWWLRIVKLDSYTYLQLWLLHSTENLKKLSLRCCS